MEGVALGGWMGRVGVQKDGSAQQRDRERGPTGSGRDVNRHYTPSTEGDRCLLNFLQNHHRCVSGGSR